MKFLQFLSISLAAAAMVSCSEKQPIDNEKAEFSVNSTIVSLTKSPVIGEDGSGKFQQGDKNTLFFHSQEGQQLLTFEYTYGKTYYWLDLGLPEHVKTCRLTGCYPTVTTSTPASFDWDITAHAEESDLLVSQPAGINVESSQPVDLTFHHVLHKLVVELTADGTTMQNDQLNNAVVKVNRFLPVANVNLLEGTVNSAKGSKQLLSSNGRKAEFIIPAQPVGDIEILIQIGDRNASYKLSTCKVNGELLTQLESGKSFKLNIEVSNHSFSIVGGNISGWESQGQANDTIII